MAEANLDQPTPKEVPQTTVEIYQPSPENWARVAPGLDHLEQATFADAEGGGFDPELMEDIFNTERGVGVILRDAQGEIIGYTVAVPLDYEEGEDGVKEDFPREDDSQDTAYVESTAVDTRFQGRGLARHLLTTLDGELVKKGYRFLERDADEANRYDETLMRFYGDKVIADKKNIHREYGMKHWMRIKLPEPENPGEQQPS